jgi:hypothetical protein
VSLNIQTEQSMSSCGEATLTHLLPSLRDACCSRATVFKAHKSGFLDIKIKDKRQLGVIRLKYNNLIVVSAKVRSIRYMFF